MKKEEMEHFNKSIGIELPVFEITQVTPKMAHDFKKGDQVVLMPFYLNVFHSIDKNRNYSLPLRALEFVIMRKFYDRVFFSNGISWVVCAKYLGK